MKQAKDKQSLSMTLEGCVLTGEQWERLSVQKTWPAKEKTKGIEVMEGRMITSLKHEGGDCKKEEDRGRTFPSLYCERFSSDFRNNFLLLESVCYPII